MHPPTKDQADIGQDNETIDCSDSEDMARQEFKDESDVNYMLSRFGITQPRGTPVFGEVDDTIDLQMAMESVREAREGYLTLPQELRNKFRSMEDMLRAIELGTLVLKAEEEAPKPTP